jgi:hypothetical protein
VTISNGGTLYWHVQLNQSSISLVNGNIYTISFMAKSASNKTINVVLQQDVSPFALYWSQDVNITTTAATYTYSFTSTVTNPNAVLRFNVGGNTITVNIDKVSMTTSVSTAPNLVQNSEFDSGTASWNFSPNNGASGSMAVVTGAGLSGTNALKVTISLPGSAFWHVQVTQPGISISSGKTYTISFMAKASANKDINVVLQQDVSPFTNYWSQNLTVTTAANTYTYAFNSTVNDANTALRFNVGGNTTTVYIDKVSVK